MARAAASVVALTCLAGAVLRWPGGAGANNI